MDADFDLPSFLAAIALGSEPIPTPVVLHGGAVLSDIDLEAYRRPMFDWDRD